MDNQAEGPSLTATWWWGSPLGSNSKPLNKSNMIGVIWIAKNLAIWMPLLGYFFLLGQHVGFGICVGTIE